MFTRAVRATNEKGRRKPALSAFLARCCLVQHPAELLLLLLRQWRSSGSLGLQQRTEKDPIVLLCADTAQIPRECLVTYMLSLKDLSVTFTTAMA
jgi:hypothetical protein